MIYTYLRKDGLPHRGALRNDHMREAKFDSLPE
jgi:hypothetical protein